MVKAAVIIPARYHSTRLEGKPLATIGGKALIQHVYENAVRSKVVQEVIVATDDERIYDFVKAFGGRVRMTAKEHTTGTDRVAEVARDVDASIIVNVQGDEPFVTAPMISEAVQPLIDESDLSMSTLMHQITEDRFDDPNVVKVVVDRRGNGMYFSRSLIPYPRTREGLRVFEHIGVYCYRKDFLLRFVSMPPSPLEMTESLEQLRALENGYPIRVVATESKDYVPLSIDTPEDLHRAQEIYGSGRQNR